METSKKTGSSAEEVTTWTFGWSAIAVHPVAAMGFLLGVLAVVLGSLLTMLTNTLDAPQAPLYHFALWSAWGGFILVSLTLMAGGFLSQSARPGIRVAMIAIGLFVLLSIPSMPIAIPPLG